jgi:predicted peptidase
MMKSCLTLGFSALLLAGCASTLRTPPQTGGQSRLTMKRKITKTVTCEYLLYLPEGYPDARRKWPLMLFLHGAGERGDSLDLVKKHGPPKLADRGQKLPFIVVSPQCPANEWWSVEVLDALLREVVSKFKVDEDRIVVTGLSMGGFGTWTLAGEYPDRFAAVAPICGGGNPLDACKLKNLPIWVFHGAKDSVVPLKSSQDMVDALKACGGNVRFTVYPDADHDSWTATYDNPEFWDWMSKQKRTP